MNMEAKMRGGLLKAIGRKFAGEALFLTDFTPTGGEGLVAFGGNAPGTIKPIELAPGRDFLVQRDAFLCAEDTVELSVAFQRRLGSIFFGGEGLFLTTLKGPGKIIIQSMTLANLATALAPFLPSTRAPSETSGSSGVLGTILEETIGRR
jgi:uncharacterized protein (AIM24 family)